VTELSLRAALPHAGLGRRGQRSARGEGDRRSGGVFI